MKRNRAPSPQAATVLVELARKREEWSYGYELCQLTGLKAGTVYPLLQQMAERGFLETDWETGAPEGRPPRHLYRLTGAGLELARGLAMERPGLLALKPAVEGV